MRYRLVTYACSALLMASGVAALAQADGMAPAENDLTGLWQQGDGQIVHFTQQGAALTSRHRSPRGQEAEVDFTATIHGNLVYGAHRGPFSRIMQKKCALQIWVGMGLTLNADRTELTGFRGDRIVDPKSCRVANSDPVTIVYRRLPADPPLE